MNLNLPASTEVNKQLPKKAIYQKFNISGSEKNRLDEMIHKIIIRNEISPKTINISAGIDVKSIFILEVMLQNQDYDLKNLNILFKLIDQKMILQLTYENMSRLIIFNDIMIEGEWKKTEDTKLNLQGLNLDTVWESIVIQTGNIELKNENTLSEQIAEDSHTKEILDKISKLENKMRTEKQTHKQREIYQKIKELKKLLN